MSYREENSETKTRWNRFEWLQSATETQAEHRKVEESRSHPCRPVALIKFKFKFLSIFRTINNDRYIPKLTLIFTNIFFLIKVLTALKELGKFVVDFLLLIFVIDLVGFVTKRPWERGCSTLSIPFCKSGHGSFLIYALNSTLQVLLFGAFG